MYKKLICAAIVILLCLSVLSGCYVKYNAVMYSRVEKWIDEDFLRENRVKAYYLNDEYDEDDDSDDAPEKYIYDENSPRSRSFIITEEAEFKSIFTDCPISVDFDKEMVLLYIFGNIYPYREYYLKKTSLEDKTLNIYVKLENKNVCDTTMPFQRCMMVKLDKLDITEVNFIKK